MNILPMIREPAGAAVRKANAVMSRSGVDGDYQPQKDHLMTEELLKMAAEFRAAKHVYDAAEHVRKTAESASSEAYIRMETARFAFHDVSRKMLDEDACVAGEVDSAAAVSLTVDPVALPVAGHSHVD